MCAHNIAIIFSIISTMPPQLVFQVKVIVISREHWEKSLGRSVTLHTADSLKELNDDNDSLTKYGCH